jgi:PKD repeat protein
VWDFGDGTTATEQHPSHVYEQSGIYTATLTVSNAYGSDSDQVVIVVDPAQTTATMPLLPGWNLISLPVIPANPAPGQVFAPIAGQYGVVWGHHGCDVADPWKRYDPISPFNDLTTVTVGMGLWINATTATTLTVVGTLPTSTDIALCGNAWNLVGYPAQAQAASAALAGIAGCYTVVWSSRANDPGDPWKKYDPAVPAMFNDLTQLEPGLGYWIRATQACTWTLPGAE